MFGLKKKKATEPADSAAEISSAAPAPRSSASAAGGPAGFGLRVAAFLADGGILFLAFCIIAILGTLLAGLADLGDLADLITGLVIILVQLLYFPLMQSSVRQATVGKLMVGIRVTDIYGNRMSTLRSFGREFAKVLSAIPFGIGFLLAAFGEKKQALHDKVASTLVVREGESHVGRALGVAVIGFVLPFVLVLSLGAAVIGGTLGAMLGEVVDEAPPAPPAPPPVAAKAAPAKAPAPAPAAAPAPAPAPSPAPATEGGAKADGAAKAMEGAAKSGAKAEGAATPGAGAEKSAPAKETASALVPAPSPATKLALPPDDEEKKPAPRARRARPASGGGAGAPAAAPAPAPAPEARPGIAPMECVIKPVMTDDEINACRRPEPAAAKR